MSQYHRIIDSLRSPRFQTFEACNPIPPLPSILIEDCEHAFDCCLHDLHPTGRVICAVTALEMVLPLWDVLYGPPPNEKDEKLQIYLNLPPGNWVNRFNEETRYREWVWPYGIIERTWLWLEGKIPADTDDEGPNLSSLQEMFHTSDPPQILGVQEAEVSNLYHCIQEVADTVSSGYTQDACDAVRSAASVFASNQWLSRGQKFWPLWWNWCQCRLAVKNVYQSEFGIGKPSTYPNIWVARFNETTYSQDYLEDTAPGRAELHNLVDQIYTDYWYDSNQPTYIASSDPVYWLTPFRVIIKPAIPWNNLSEEQIEIINLFEIELLSTNEPDYFSVRSIDTLPIIKAQDFSEGRWEEEFIYQPYPSGEEEMAEMLNTEIEEYLRNT